MEMSLVATLFPGIASLFVQDPVIACARIFMIIFGFILAYLGFKRTLEPLIMVPMGVGMICINCGVLFLDGGKLGTLFLDPLVSEPGALMNIMQINFLQPIYNLTFSNSLVACLVFMGIGAMCEIGFILANPWTSIIIAIFAEAGTFVTLILGVNLGLTPPEAAAVYMDFIPAYIPNASKVKNQFQMDASTSTIFLKLVGHTKLLGDFVVYTAGNFRGGDKVFQLRNAYMSFRNVTVGYTYGGFMDLAALPSTIDFQGPNGATFYRATQLAYTYKGLKNWRFHASIEVPSVDGATNDELSVAQQRMPDFTAYAQYGWGANSHLRVGGIVRSMTYTSTLSNHASDVTGWGVQASTSFNLSKKWEIFGQATYGKGIGQYLNDISNLNVDIVPNPEKEGKMQALPMLGWFAGAQYNICPKIFVSGTYSMSRLYSENGYPNDQPSSYRYGQYLVANVFWNVTPNMQVGAEYLRGWRTDFSNSTHHANRMNLLVQYSF